MNQASRAVPLGSSAWPLRPGSITMGDIRRARNPATSRRYHRAASDDDS